VDVWRRATRSKDRLHVLTSMYMYTKDSSCRAVMAGRKLVVEAPDVESLKKGDEIQTLRRLLSNVKGVFPLL
jgi:hypothetical protein